MIDFTILAHVNATLNALCALLLALGFREIRAKRIERHRACMTAATAVSVLFLISYIVYHAQVGSVKFTAIGWIRPLYFAILISHVVLAAVILPLAPLTFYRGFRGQIDKHRKLARFVWPLWMYVSLTGVAVYVLLYHLFPPV